MIMTARKSHLLFLLTIHFLIFKKRLDLTEQIMKSDHDVPLDNHLTLVLYNNES